MATPVRDTKQHKPLPAPNSDFYEFAADLPVEEQALIKKVREYCETKVQPIVNKYWVEDSFPFELLPSFKAEVIYSYEGTYQMQTLIVGKAITGFSAFV